MAVNQELLAKAFASVNQKVASSAPRRNVQKVIPRIANGGEQPRTKTSHSQRQDYSQDGAPELRSRSWVPPGYKTVDMRETTQRDFYLQNPSRLKARDWKPVPAIEGQHIEGGLIHTLGTRPIEHYNPRLHPGGNMQHPGLIMPSVCITSQALFGSSAVKTGLPSHLRCASQQVPSGAPRFLTHDVVSATSSLFSNFRKTAVAWPGEPALMPRSEYQQKFDIHGHRVAANSKRGLKRAQTSVGRKR